MCGDAHFHARMGANRHPEKFTRLAADADWYENWKACRDEYIEWESQQKNKNE